MARNLDPKCRQCRREGEKLFLKAEKCFTDKCSVDLALLQRLGCRVEVVGDGALRYLFEQARLMAACIMFIDELVAMGRARSSGSSRGVHDEKEQTLNQLLVELDGFDPTSGIVLLGATNRPARWPSRGSPRESALGGSSCLRPTSRRPKSSPSRKPLHF